MIQTVEKQVTALVARLHDRLPDAVDRVNAERPAPDFPLKRPAQVLDYAPPLSRLTSFPTVAVVQGQTRFTDDTGDALTGWQSLTVVVYLQSTEPRALAWGLRRYADAVMDVVLADRNLGDNGWGIVPVSVDPGPSLTREEDPREIISFTGISFEVRTEQDVG